MPPVLVVILNAPPHLGVHQVQLRLAELLDASWQRIDPFCQLDENRHLFLEGVASGWDEAARAVREATQGRRHQVIDWRVSEGTYQLLKASFSSTVVRLALVTVAPPVRKALASKRGSELSFRQRGQIRRFYERKCHRVPCDVMIDLLPEDPAGLAAVMFRELRRSGFQH